LLARPPSCDPFASPFKSQRIRACTSSPSAPAPPQAALTSPCSPTLAAFCVSSKNPCPRRRITNTYPIANAPPIQRPAHSARLSLPNHRELSAGPGVIHLQAPASISPHAPKSSGRSHANGHTGRAHSNSGSGSASGSGSSAASSPAPAASGSNLSSRAPPFEPSGLGLSAARSAQTVASVANRSELNPGSSPFAPRPSVAQVASSQARPRGGST
ncbi:uncharacterized protein B0H18DRAFT_1210972, partial [Fomitopsis serialis]|uniref:uncharacterized protein n=1 Tax=Fomitopsis serialis TaxID=139415 RepID=UPI0020088356